MNFIETTPNPDIATVMDVEPKEVWAYHNEIIFIDVREPDEWIGELGHIENSQNIPLDTLPEQINGLDSQKTIVFICRSGRRSSRATVLAQEKGFEKVYNLRGGMLLWNKEQLPIQTTNGSI